jgi:hypothetical protein
MKHLKNFNQLNEGHITLTSEEHKSVERVMKKLPQLLSGSKLKLIQTPKGPDNNFEYIKNLIDSGSTDIVYVDSIDYLTATGTKSKVGIYIVSVGKERYFGQYLPGDSNDPHDNIILINQSHHNSDSLSIQSLRTILIHELIHAKDPKVNQLFTDKFKKSAFKKNYYKRRFEFEAFTGQLLNVISNSTYKFLKEGWSSKDLKEIFDDILEHFKDTKKDFIDSFEKQNPEFMKTITKEIEIEGMSDFLGSPWLETDYSKIPEIDKYGDRTKLKPDTLMFLNREWDKNKKISSEKNIEDLSKVTNDFFVCRTDRIKRENSDYSEFLKDLYKEIKKQVDFVNSKREEKIELNYKTISDWMNVCKNVSFMSRKTNIK